MIDEKAVGFCLDEMGVKVEKVRTHHGNEFEVYLEPGQEIGGYTIDGRAVVGPAVGGGWQHYEFRAGQTPRPEPTITYAHPEAVEVLEETEEAPRPAFRFTPATQRAVARGTGRTADTIIIDEIATEFRPMPATLRFDGEGDHMPIPETSYLYDRPQISSPHFTESGGISMPRLEAMRGHWVRGKFVSFDETVTYPTGDDWDDWDTEEYEPVEPVPTPVDPEDLIITRDRAHDVEVADRPRTYTFGTVMPTTR